MRARAVLLGLLPMLTVAAPVFGEETRGVLIASTATAAGDDLRFGAIAAGFARRGWESFVAADTVRPPADAARMIVRARRFLDEARRLRRKQSYRAAAADGDRAIRILEAAADEKQHLGLLVEALIERGATAVALGDSAKAETVFLAAIALDPLRQLDTVLFGEEVRALFGEVRRASRQLRYGSIRVEVAALPEASVAVDFDTPHEPPLEAKLSDGRHFVSVSAPGRHEVVALVAVRAGRQTDVSLRPPTSGDPTAREHALSRFKADAAGIAGLSAATGLRFVALTRADRANVSLAVHDGRTGQPISGAIATLSVNPSPAEIDAAVVLLVDALAVFDPEVGAGAVAGAEGGAWYASWWWWSIVGVAVAGAATATALVLTREREIEYRFEP